MRKLGLVALTVATLSTAVFARGGFWHHRGGHNYYHQQVATQVAELTDAQKADLKFMFEEEKLARDVYITLGQKWEHRTFLNIQKSEQRHMDRVKYLLEKYGLEVPATEDQIGVFENEELQALYNDLIAQGEASLADALNVGILIEQTDIADLEEKIVDAPADIQRIYGNLLKGSDHHLRAFTYALNNI